jgi:signal transduction histidine kinase
MRRPSSLSIRLALAFTLAMAAMAIVCVVALVDLVNVSGRTRGAVSRQVALLRQATAFDALLYQKGFVAAYMVTGDRVWLHKLEATRGKFAAWLASVGPSLLPPQRAVLRKIVDEDRAYDEARSKAVALFQAGRREEAKAMLPGYHVHLDRLVELSHEFGELGRVETQEVLVGAERSIRRLARLLVGTSILGVLFSVVVGFLWARRIARPMYQLQLQIESATERTRIRLAPEEAPPEGLADQVGALIRRVEESHAALVEGRRRLAQSEKMSAIGELAAKLAHEILNPLTGMKAAVQLMKMDAESKTLDAGAVRSVADALAKEATRIEQLVKRLIGYARPLAPVVELCSVEQVVESAAASVAPQTRASGVTIRTRIDEGVPPLEADPLLLTQVFVNLLRNAAVHVFRTRAHGREEVHVEVTDEGSGIREAEQGRLFTPFHSTKPTGHGLGLATSKNIVLEHGGALEAWNRPDRPGAVFRVSLPAVR